MAIRWDIRPIAGHQAIELHGLDPTTLADSWVRDELNALWLHHGLIAFRGIDDAAALVALSRCFGECQTHPIRQSNTDPAHPEITNVQYGPGNENGNIYEVDGVRLGAWLPLHFDLVYVDKVNHGGLLRPVTVPERGGATLFADKIALYEALPARLQRAVAGLEVFYRFSVDMTKMKFPTFDLRKISMGYKFRDIQSRAHTYPRSIHPLVYRQSGTGRQMLNLSPWFADAIVGMENEEGDALLRELCKHVADSGKIYAHRWQKGDMVLWDNWRMLHGAEGVPPECDRWLQRTTIAGDYSLGRLEARRAEVDELRLVDV